jgi:hypothetical protein
MDETVKLALLVAPGAALAAAAYLVYLGTTKGLPAVKAKLSSWWNAAKKDAATIKSDLAALESRVGVLETKAGVTPPAKPAPAAPAPATPAAPLLSPNPPVA